MMYLGVVSLDLVRLMKYRTLLDLGKWTSRLKMVANSVLGGSWYPTKYGTSTFKSGSILWGDGHI